MMFYGNIKGFFVLGNLRVKWDYWKSEKRTQGIEISYFDTGQNFEKEAYYNYFGAPDKGTRRYAIAVFTVYLGNWYNGCSFPFLNENIWFF